MGGPFQTLYTHLVNIWFIRALRFIPFRVSYTRSGPTDRFFPSEALAHFGDPESSIALLVRALSNGLYIPPVYRNKTFNAGGNGRKHFRKLWEKTFFFFAGAIVDEEICLSHQSDRSAAWPLFPSLLSLNKRRRRCFTLNILRQICRKKIQRFRNCLGRKISKRDDDGDWKIVSIVDQLF